MRGSGSRRLKRAEKVAKQQTAEKWVRQIGHGGPDPGRRINIESPGRKPDPLSPVKKRRSFKTIGEGKIYSLEKDNGHGKSPGSSEEA